MDLSTNISPTSSMGVSSSPVLCSSRLCVLLVRVSCKLCECSRVGVWQLLHSRKIDHQINSTNKLKLALEHFHVSLSPSDLAFLYSSFPSTTPGSFDFDRFAYALSALDQPVDSASLDVLHASHAAAGVERARRARAITDNIHNSTNNSLTQYNRPFHWLSGKAATKLDTLKQPQLEQPPSFSTQHNHSSVSTSAGTFSPAHSSTAPVAVSSETSVAHHRVVLPPVQRVCINDLHTCRRAALSPHLSAGAPHYMQATARWAPINNCQLKRLEAAHTRCLQTERIDFVNIGRKRK